MTMVKASTNCEYSRPPRLSRTGPAGSPRSVMSSCITIVDDFLFEDDLDHIRTVTRPQRGKLDVYGGLQEADFIRPLLRSAEAHFEAVYGLALQQVLLRFEGNTGPPPP
ncbi:MAG: hypothetical protein ACI8RZ_006058 [Myxococcota bacterium]|jgi:hypothetical protein